jgi:hypothetical protein
MRSRLLLAVSTLALTSASALASIDINGGSSWGGWSHRGNSRDVGIWGAQSTTRSYELYTTVFTFNNDAVTGGTQVRGNNTPVGFASGAFSTISGGLYNEAVGNFATVGGGYRNAAALFADTVAGGEENNARAEGGTIGGGTFNSVTAKHATVLGGVDNDLKARCSTAVGSNNHIAEGHDGAMIFNAASCNGTKVPRQSSHQANDFSDWRLLGTLSNGLPGVKLDQVREI